MPWAKVSEELNAKLASSVFDLNILVDSQEF
jgi:hypothetical protein